MIYMDNQREFSYKYKSSKIGKYEWLQWENKPVKIIDIIGNIELV